MKSKGVGGSTSWGHTNPIMAVSKPAIALKADAYTVLFLHCCRYPTRSLNGLLLGCAAADGSVSVEKTLPLFHTQISLAPMLEAALLRARRGGGGGGRPDSAVLSAPRGARAELLPHMGPF